MVLLTMTLLLCFRGIYQPTARDPHPNVPTVPQKNVQKEHKTALQNCSLLLHLSIICTTTCWKTQAQNHSIIFNSSLSLPLPLPLPLLLPPPPPPSTSTPSFQVQLISPLVYFPYHVLSSSPFTIK